MHNMCAKCLSKGAGSQYFMCSVVAQTGFLHPETDASASGNKRITRRPCAVSLHNFLRRPTSHLLPLFLMFPNPNPPSLLTPLADHMPLFSVSTAYFKQVNVRGVDHCLVRLSESKYTNLNQLRLSGLIRRIIPLAIESKPSSSLRRQV